MFSYSHKSTWLFNLYHWHCVSCYSLTDTSTPDGCDILMPPSSLTANRCAVPLIELFLCSTELPLTLDAAQPSVPRLKPAGQASPERVDPAPRPLYTCLSCPSCCPGSVPCPGRIDRSHSQHLRLGRRCLCFPKVVLCAPCALGLGFAFRLPALGPHGCL